MSNNLFFKILDNDSAHYTRAITLCEEVLQKSFSQKELESQNKSLRIGGFVDDTLCATAMITRDDDKFFLQQLAVKKEMQNKGIGSQLLKFCEEVSQENEARVLYAYAKEGMGRSVVNFFIKNEYFCGDEEFLEDGIPHKIVWRILE